MTSLNPFPLAFDVITFTMIGRDKIEPYVQEKKCGLAINSSTVLAIFFLCSVTLWRSSSEAIHLPPQTTIATLALKRKP